MLGGNLPFQFPVATVPRFFLLTLRRNCPIFRAAFLKWRGALTGAPSDVMRKIGLVPRSVPRPR